ncbi:MAG: phenylalanine--tRNA ligase beta subunit-related protein [Candidatus Tagabacteria bacterium]
MKKIIIGPEIFERFPDFKRGIIVVRDIENAVSNPEIERLLNEEIRQKTGRNSVEHEFVKAWGDVYLKFGSNPNKFPPSIKSLLKRIEKGGSIPFINSVVALFNYISIKYLVPAGGDDVEKIEGNLRLGFAKGNEFFTPLGSEIKETSEAGEVIYFDDKTLNVMCRRWNWRNSDFTKITPETKEIVINVDGIGPVSQSLIEEARDEMAKLLIEYCKAALAVDLLNREKNEIILANDGKL